ncbi:hypothetical protein INR49_024822 [Caranx melampygus]|nr:hypothetical protein INR49_024822 [Caranx melampygus]
MYSTFETRSGIGSYIKRKRKLIVTAQEILVYITVSGSCWCPAEIRTLIGPQKCQSLGCLCREVEFPCLQHRPVDHFRNGCLSRDEAIKRTMSRK